MKVRKKSKEARRERAMNCSSGSVAEQRDKIRRNCPVASSGGDFALVAGHGKLREGDAVRRTHIGP